METYLFLMRAKLPEHNSMLTRWFRRRILGAGHISSGSVAIVACGGYRTVSAGSSWCRWSCHAPTPHTGFGVPIPARYFRQARHVMRVARRHRHSPGFHLWQTQKDHFSSINNRETEPWFRLCRSSVCIDSMRRLSVLGAFKYLGLRYRQPVAMLENPCQDGGDDSKTVYLA